MGPGRVTWQDKVRKATDWPAKGVSTRLAKLLGKPQRTIYNWLEGKWSPQNESAVIDLFAKRLKVPRSWLEDGKPGPPPTEAMDVSAEWIALVDSMPWPSSKIKNLAFAIGDRKSAEMLADVWEAIRQRQSQGAAP